MTIRKDAFDVNLPSTWSQIFRFITTVVITAIAVGIVAAILDGVTIDSRRAGLAVAVALGLLNALVAPIVARLTLPLSVLTFGLAAIVLDGLMVLLAFYVTPGVSIADPADAVVAAILLSIVSMVISSLLAIDDEAWLDRRTVRRLIRKSPKDIPAEPGLLVVQIDGLGYDVLEWAMRSGDAPNLRTLAHGSHVLHAWQTDWSSQTGASQAGLLLGSNDDMPAFRWVEKATKKLVVSNKRDSAGLIESRHDKARGLLADDGASFGNLFTGGATHGLMVMSAAGKRKEGGFGSGYGAYFSQPYNATRTAIRFVGEVLSERRSAAIDRARKVEPSVHRGWSFAAARAFTTTVLQDVCVDGVIEQLVAGRKTIYVDLLGYDEVAHHVGIHHRDALTALRAIDRDVGRLAKVAAVARRDYNIVVLSDHGQTQGPSFRNQFGFTLKDLVERLTHQQAEGTGFDEAGEGAHFARREEEDTEVPTTMLQVLASGNLGLVYFMDSDNRLTESEIHQRYPGLLNGLVKHDGIGFVLVAGDRDGEGIVIGANGRRSLPGGPVEGEDPLAPFAANTPERVLRTHRFENVADIMINAAWDPEFEETYAFEDFAGSHGGLGGPQEKPFVLLPLGTAFPDDCLGAAAVHDVLIELRDGAPVTPA